MALIEVPLEFSPSQLDIDFPFPVNRPSAYNDVYLRGKLYADTSAPILGVVFYFHGSGAAGPISGPLVNKLTGAGYRVVALTYFGSGESSVSPFKYSYGNVTAPEFTQLFIKTSYWVKAAIKGSGVLGSGPSNIVLLGHSMGASAVLAYLAGYAGEVDPLFWPVFKGAIVNGATVGGLGNNSWNDVNRNINTLSGIVNLVEGKVIMTYSDNDPYCPPDYAKRIQAAIRPDSEIYLTSPGPLGHSWMNASEANAQTVLNWVNQLINDEPIRNSDGSLAKAGPV